MPFLFSFALARAAGPGPAADTGGSGACACDQKEMAARAGAAADVPGQSGTKAFSRDSIYQLDAQFTDDAGQPFRLGSLRGRPVVVDMFFASCGYACPLTVTEMLALQQMLPGDVRARTAFVLVSFDSTRDTPATLARYRTERHLGGNWILLHGDPGSVRELAALLGVQYREGADGSFSHSNVLTILNPEGEIVHQRTGLQGGLPAAAHALAQSVR